MTSPKYPHLSQLGGPSAIPDSPDRAVLETFPNPHPELDYVVRLTAPEFTSLCPITGQPDFAVMIVDYVPKGSLVESKSLKLFLGSFRNHGAFHEDCTVAVHNRLRDVMDPRFIRVVGLWSVRGGITIDVSIQTGILPESCVLLPLLKTGYRGGRE